MNAKTVNALLCRGKSRVAAIRHNIYLIKNKYKIRLDIEKDTARLTVGTVVKETAYSNSNLSFESWDSAIHFLNQIKSKIGGKELITNTKQYKGKLFGLEFDADELAPHIQLKEKLKIFQLV